MSEWIQTYTGLAIEPRNPTHESVCIEDIAHALSMICRFNGHCSKFYSVAEHSVHVAMLVPPELRLAALLHDAAEAYLGDIPRPLKTDRDREAEDRALDVIFEALGVSHPIVNERRAIKAADAAMLATEAEQIMATPPKPWATIASPAAVTVQCWPPVIAEAAFLAKWKTWRLFK